MQIIKGNGERVEYDPGRVRNTLKRAGADRKTIDRVLSVVQKKVREGMTTAKLHKIVHAELQAADVCSACRYNLKDALFKMGPAGFVFEQYVASILRQYDYDAVVPEGELDGVCVRHEVDVIAKKDHRTIMIEAKFRRKERGYVDLKDTMATWSRFLDLVDASRVGKTEHLDEVWIVTNGRFSDRAQAFGTCKGMHLIGWNFPKEFSFASLVDHTTLYPVTVVDSLLKAELESFSEEGVTLCAEVADMKPSQVSKITGMPDHKANEVIGLCKQVITPTGHSHKPDNIQL